MQSFLSKVAHQIISNHSNISNITIILPSKRAGLFLKTELKKHLNKTSLLPKILSIEDFIKEISEFGQLDNVTLIFEFYKVYCKITNKENADSFDVFSKWASILLHDFNEIDSNLIDAENILNYITESKRIEHWNLKDQDQTALTKNYLAFFNKIKVYYKNLYWYLSSKKVGYQGLLYRVAFENISQFIKQNLTTKFVFVGFNALNKAEEKIIHELLINKKADIFWDNDRFYDNTDNQAGAYFKKYNSQWAYYNTHTFRWKENNINTEKNIFIYGVPKNISQIKKVANILSRLNTNDSIQNTAVILGNEKLLPALLNSIPKEIDRANITMGYELQNIPLAKCFESIFKLHINKNKLDKKGAFYYKDFIQVLEDPFLVNYWNQNKSFHTKLHALIFINKNIFISQNDIEILINNDPFLSELFNVLFSSWKDDTAVILQNFILIIDFFRKNENVNALNKEYLFRFYKVFQQLINLNKEYGFIKDLNTLYQFYKQILKTEKLSFQGEPLQGLQIMGVLESRVLDFENVIITSVNEGFLPSGNTENSFIPFDIKIENGLPTYNEKDAIFAYHFFRLFHRAKNIYVLYNTVTDDYGSGEQSRFITQLEIENEFDSLKNVHLVKSMVIPKLNSLPIPLQEIKKTESIIQRLQEIAKEGFSPSSFGLYIRNPIDFYKRKVLRLKEFKEVEETIAASTFGTIIHDTLEKLYIPFIKKYITKKDIFEMKEKLEAEVTNQFKRNYSLNSISSGKNYLAFEIAKQFLINFLNYEIKELAKNDQIKILALETNLSLNYSFIGLPFPIKLKGKVDRIDEINGTLRIIDYKTGKVGSNDLKINNWDFLTVDEKYSKSFQVLLYAYMYVQNHNLDFEKHNIESGIISFKNLRSGFLKINNSKIDQLTLDEFLVQLNNLLLEIYDPKIPFTEKEITKKKY